MEKLDFYFSQSALNAFIKCPMIFKYRYIDGIYLKNKSTLMEFGNNFHIMAERYFLGLKSGKKIVKDKRLLNFFSSLEEKFTINNLYSYFPEYEMKININNLKLLAKYDLIIDKKDGILEIWDWKTGEKKLLEKNHENDMQTLIYPYILKRTSEIINSKKIESNNIKIKYWNPGFANEIIEFNYSDEKDKIIDGKLRKLIEKIKKFKFLEYNKIENENCKSCSFKVMCKREGEI